MTLDEHTAWFQRVIHSDDCIVFIILSAGTPIGQVRFDIDETNTATISIYLLPQHCGRGLGTRALRLACDALRTKRPDVAAVHARIRSGNSASIAAFTKAGFAHVEAASSDADHVLMHLPLHTQNSRSLDHA